MNRIFQRIHEIDRAFNARSWWCVFGVFVFLKLILIAHSEIGTALFDEYGYAENSLHWYDEANAPMTAFCRPPGLPFLAFLARNIGLPYRIFIELFACAASGLISFRLGLLARSHLMGIILAGLLILHPWLFDYASSFLSEAPFLLTTFCWLACLASLLQAPLFSWRSPALWISGFCLFFMTLLRLEEPILLGFALIAALGFGWLSRSTSGPGRWCDFRVAVFSFCLPALILVAGKQLVCWVNYEKCGVSSISALESPGLTDLLQALNQIQAPDPQQYAPITHRSFAMAMDASPSLALLREPMARREPAAIQESNTYTHSEEGWQLMWTLIDSTFEIQGALHHGSLPPREINAYWEKCARQLQAALSANRLPRAAYAPYPVNPNYRLWLGSFPKSWLKALAAPWNFVYLSADKRTISAREILEANWSEDAVYLLDATADRRSALLPSTFIDGYAFSRRGPVDAVFLETSDGLRLGEASVRSLDRLPDDLARHMPSPLTNPVLCHFAIALPYAVPVTSRLVLMKDGHRISSHPISETYYVGTTLAATATTDGMAEIRIRDIHPATETTGWRGKLEIFLLRHYGWLLGSAVICWVLLSFAAARETEQAAAGCPKLAAFFGILGFAFLLRSSFYALADVCTLPNYERYLRSLSMWIPLGLFCLCCFLGDALARSQRPKK